MVAALLSAVYGGSFSTSLHREQVSALYVGEAGVAHAMALLETNQAWTDGFDEEPTLTGVGTYTVTFNTTPSTSTVGSNESVNNLAGAGAVNGPRGPNTVPAGSVDLVVIARVGRAERRIEVLIQGGGLPATDVAGLASGRVKFKGDVKVAGVTSVTDPSPAGGGIHSNLATTDPDIIEWLDSASHTAIFQGTVSTRASQGINLTGATLNGSPPTEYDSARRPVPAVDVVAQVDAKAGATPVTIPTLGSFVLGTGAPEDFYHNGNVSLQGDLDLNGATLYVNGDLDVNGSIKGDGAIYVKGETRFRGNAEVTTPREDKTAIYSKGSIELLGFDGTEFMDAYAAANPGDVGVWWTDAQVALEAMQVTMSSHTPAELVTPGHPARDDLDEQRRVLGQASSYRPWEGRSTDTFFRMADRLSNDPNVSGETVDFLVERFHSLDAFYDAKMRASADPADNSNYTGSQDASVVINDWLSGTRSRVGWFDAAIDGDGSSIFQEAIKEFIVLTNQVSYDRIGTSHFRGLLYTNGFVYADNEVNILGAIMAIDDGSQPEKVLDGVTVKPGDLFLNNGTSLTYVEEFFDHGAATASGISLRTWLGR